MVAQTDVPNNSPQLGHWGRLGAFAEQYLARAGQRLLAAVTPSIPVATHMDDIPEIRAVADAVREIWATPRAPLCPQQLADLTFQLRVAKTQWQARQTLADTFPDRFSPLPEKYRQAQDLLLQCTHDMLAHLWNDRPQKNAPTDTPALNVYEVDPDIALRTLPAKIAALADQADDLVALDFLQYEAAVMAIQEQLKKQPRLLAQAIWRSDAYIMLLRTWRRLREKVNSSPSGITAPTTEPCLT